MSELKMISPLLDDMIVENERIGLNGQTCHTLRNHRTGEQFILRTISLPETDSRIRALILSGAYPDEQAVHTYYGRLAADMKEELQIGQKLATTGCFAGAVSFQIEPKSSGVGYDVYILYPMNIALSEFLSMNAMTRLRALNLGIDLCDSITACRQAGYLFLNVRPETIYLMPSDRFMLGDLGLTSLEFLEYAGVPEEYLGTYSAPELSDITASPNTTIDIYALGMILYHIYNGNHDPFEDEGTNAAMAEKLRLSGKPLPSPIYADYEIAEIILKACSFNKEDRYQTPEELKQALMLYMQRNAVSDELIAPPIVADPVPVSLTDEEIDDEPIRMTDVSELDENFRQSFAPDLSGSGDDVQDESPIAEEPVTEPAEEVIEETVEDPIAEPLETPIEAKEEEIAETVVEEVSEEIEEPIEEELIDPDQVDLDTLLASVNAVVGDVEEFAEEEEDAQVFASVQGTSEAPAEHDYIDGEEDKSTSDEESEEDSPKRPRIALWTTIVAAVIGVALLGYFLLNWYFVDVTELKAVYTTPSQIMVELVTDDNPKHFIVTCSDGYGNVYQALRSGKQYCFTELDESTSYTISVSAAEYHKFSTAAPSLTETTGEYTRITDVNFDRLEEDGAIIIQFQHAGPSPDLWELTYYKKGESTAPSTLVFRGNSIDLTDLTLFETYIFSIKDAGGVFMSEETVVEYQVLPHVSATNFVIENIIGNTVHLKWDYEGSTTQQWYVSCCAEGMEDLTVNTEKTTAELTLPDFNKDYTIYLTALGIDEPQEIVLSADAIIVSNLSAQLNENGEVVVTWDTPAGEPEGGWLVNYRLNDAYYSTNGPTVSCAAEDENSVTLKYLPADATYTITLLPVATETNQYGVFTVEVQTAKAQPFTDYQIRPAAPYGDGTNNEAMIALWAKPNKEKWDFRDLNTARRTTYSANEAIAFCVQIDSCDLSAAVTNDKAHLTYAVRDANGKVVAFEIIEYTDEAKTKPLTWPGVWFERRHTGTIPTPYSATEVDENGNPVVLTGKFSVEIYINGKLLATKGFTIEA